MSLRLARPRLKESFSDPFVAWRQRHFLPLAAKRQQFGWFQENLPTSRDVYFRHSARAVAVDWQDSLEAIRRSERPTADKDFLALITHSDKNPGVYENSSGSTRERSQFGCTCHDRLGKRVFGFAFRNAGSGYDLPLPETIG